MKKSKYYGRKPFGKKGKTGTSRKTISRQIAIGRINKLVSFESLLRRKNRDSTFGMLLPKK